MTAISGSWRITPPKLVRDLVRDVRSLAAEGGGIVTGGALGVDLIATETWLEEVPSAERLLIILPSSLATYAAHYHQRAQEGVITDAQATHLVEVLEEVRRRRPSALRCLDFETLDEHSYYVRNSAVLEEATDLAAYQVNDSAGTQDTIDKAAVMGLPTTVLHYRVTV